LLQKRNVLTGDVLTMGRFDWIPLPLEARRVMIKLNTLSCLILKHIYSVVGIALLWCFGKNCGSGGEIRSFLIRQWCSSLDYSERFY